MKISLRRDKPETRIAALQQQISDWEGKIAAMQSSADALAQQRAALEAEREPYFLPAYGDDDAKARAAIDRLDTDIDKCGREQQRYSAVIAQANSKLAPLREELAQAERELKRQHVRSLLPPRIAQGERIIGMLEQLKTELLSASEADHEIAKALGQLPFAERFENTVRAINARSNQIAELATSLLKPVQEAGAVTSSDSLLDSIDSLPAWGEVEGKQLYRALNMVGGVAGQKLEVGDEVWLAHEVAEPLISSGSLVRVSEEAALETAI
jgi:DNA repair exonuclease SbcCD ATPase subunit